MLSFVRMRPSFGCLHLLPVIIMINGFVTSFSQSCEETDLKGCMDELQKLTNKQDLAFAQNDEELTKTCGHLQETMDCVNKFTDRCFDLKQKEVYMTLTAGAQALLSDLCQPTSDFRKEYLKHAPCFKSLAQEYSACSDNFLKQQEIVRKTSMTNGEKVKRSCCLFDGYRHCTYTAVLRKCTVEAAKMGESIVIKASGPLVQAHCASYKYSSPECAAAASISIPSSFVFVLMLIIVLNHLSSLCL